MNGQASLNEIGSREFIEIENGNSGRSARNNDEVYRNRLELGDVVDLSPVTSNHLERDVAEFWDWVVQDGANQEGGSQFAFSVENLMDHDLSRDGGEAADDNKDGEVYEAVNEDLVQ